MRIGITMDNNEGLEGNVSSHFGQCRYFLIVEIENGKIKSADIFQNGAQHGGGGCLAVDEILKHKVSHVISGGMGMGAQNKFTQKGIKIFGFSGKAKNAVEKLVGDSLGKIEPCQEHGDCH